MFVAAIVGQVVRVHDGDPQAKEMVEYTVARRAKVTLNGKKVGLADLNNGDEVTFHGGSREGFREVRAVRSKDAPFPVQSARLDLSKPRTVELVEPSDPKLEGQWVDSGTPAEEVTQQSGAVKAQPPARPNFDNRTKHNRVSGDRGEDEGVTSGEALGGESPRTVKGDDKSHARSPAEATKDASKSPPPPKRH